MPKREPKAGDYYLLPFAGRKRDLLVRVVAPGGGGGHHRVGYAGRTGMSESLVLLSSCHRCSPSRAARILGVAMGEGGQKNG
jgi:hypothetical protein